MMSTPLGSARLSRRRALRGAGLAGVGVPLLAACGSDSSGTATDPTPTDSPAESEAPGKQSGGAAPADALVGTADVPSGGGTVLADEKLVVTQPATGEFKCFTAVCTHQGCVVADVDGGTINCACHGSSFSIEDGSVVNGPATAPLEEFAVSVQRGSVVRS